MGLASSQARLLSITARLTSNEYESQQISNAKMRLATQSQEASEAYIAALNDTQYSFVTFNSSGESANTPLTAALLYEYADNKNQYILTNSAGKVLLSTADYKNYEKSKNLDEFLECYGVTKSFKTKELQSSHDNVFKNYSKYAQYWSYAVGNYPYPQYGNSAGCWTYDKSNAQLRYYDELSKYRQLAAKKSEGEDISNIDLQSQQYLMEREKETFTKLISYVSAKESKLIEDCLSKIDPATGLWNNDTITVGTNKDGSAITTTYKDLYEGYMTYKDELAKYNDELDNLGISANNAYEYSDTSKAQWYTNLWYKINGPSTDKSDLNNYAFFNAPDGIREYYGGISSENVIPQNDSKILNSSVWITNALSKGLVNIEKASYNGSEMTLQDDANPFKFNLNGISWTGQIYSSIADIVESDNDKKIAQAEAEYKRKTSEINAKDEKYQRKISLLDSEHNAIQTEYESVKTAMNKNIDRSFKAFQG